MILSPAQTKTFWRLWSQACHARGWTREAGLSAAQIDAHRKDLLKHCGFDSLTAVDRTNGFTKIKAELLILIGVSVQAGIEAHDPHINRARTLRHFIRNNLLPCLALYLSNGGDGHVGTLNPDPNLAAAEAYLTGLLKDFTRWHKTDRPNRSPTLDDLDAKPTLHKSGRDGVSPSVNGRAQALGPSQLDQLIMTLSARINAMRNKAGHTIHDMKTLAGVECNCAECTHPRVTLLQSRESAGVIAPPIDQPF